MKNWIIIFLASILTAILNDPRFNEAMREDDPLEQIICYQDKYLFYTYTRYMQVEVVPSEDNTFSLIFHDAEPYKY